MQTLAAWDDSLEAPPAPRAAFPAEKLFLPRARGALVARPDLVGALDDADGRLVLVVAPAGYGKSTLVSQWLTHAGRPAAWVSLDEGDDEPAVFFRLVVAALETVDPGLAAGAAALLDDQGAVFPPQ